MKRFYFLGAALALLCLQAEAQTGKRLIGVTGDDHKYEFLYNADGKLSTQRSVETEEGKTSIEENIYTYTPTQIVMINTTNNSLADKDVWTSTLQNGRVTKDNVSINNNTFEREINYTYDAQGQLVKIIRKDSYEPNTSTVDITWKDGLITATKTTRNGKIVEERTYEYETTITNYDLCVHLSPLSSILSYEALYPTGQMLEGAYGVACKHPMKALHNKYYYGSTATPDENDITYTFVKDSDGWVTTLTAHDTEDNSTEISTLHWSNISTNISSATAVSNNAPEYYNIKGERIAHPGKGFNIVRDADGNARKVILK